MENQQTQHTKEQEQEIQAFLLVLTKGEKNDKTKTSFFGNIAR